MMEGTVAGIAAGVVASGTVDLQQVTRRSTALEVSIDGTPRDIALVDVAVSTHPVHRRAGAVGHRHDIGAVSGPNGCRRHRTVRHRRAVEAVGLERTLRRSRFARRRRREGGRANRSGLGDDRTGVLMEARGRWRTCRNRVASMHRRPRRGTRVERRNRTVGPSHPKGQRPVRGGRGGGDSGGDPSGSVRRRVVGASYRVSPTVNRSRTLALIWSRMRRTWSIPWPAGSSRPQSSEGTKTAGQLSSIEQPMVNTESARSTISWEITLGWWPLEADADLGHGLDNDGVDAMRGFRPPPTQPRPSHSTDGG